MQAGRLAPTYHFALFDLAERLHQTVRRVLTGDDAPLTNMEFYLWGRYRAARMRLEQQARPK